MASSVRPGSRLRAAWNENISPWKLCNRVSCNSRAMRVRSSRRSSTASVEFPRRPVLAQPVEPPQEDQKRRRADRVNRAVWWKRGSMESARLSPVSFHIPLLLHAMTRNRYLRGLRFE